MELKRVLVLTASPNTSLLIVPYGIETWKGPT